MKAEPTLNVATKKKQNVQNFLVIASFCGQRSAAFCEIVALIDQYRLRVLWGADDELEL